jgi:predicted lipoprotein with Yx(FWY)xxD motif
VLQEPMSQEPVSQKPMLQDPRKVRRGFLRHARSHPFLVAAALAALGLGAAACSSSASPTTSTSGTTAQPASSTSSTVKMESNSTYGSILVDSAGKALYTYGPDKGHGGQATCTGSCLQEWPPLVVPSGTEPTGGTGVSGTLSAVKQSNGTYQVTYNGSPLYTFVEDNSPGQVTGNGVEDFSVATVAAGSSSSTPSSMPSSTSKPSSTTTTGGSSGYGGY